MGPVKGHVASILEHVVVRVAHDANVTEPGLSLLNEAVEGILGVGGVASDGCSNLLVDNDVDLDASLCSALQDFVKTPFLGEVRRTSQEELGADPPVFEVDNFLGPFEGHGDGVEVVAAIDVPLDVVTLTLRSIRLETVALGNSSTLGVSPLLVLLVVAVVSIDQILKLADAVLQVNGADLGIVQVGVFELVPQLAHEPAVFFFGALSLFSGSGGIILRRPLLVGANVAGVANDAHGGSSSSASGSQGLAETGRGADSAALRVPREC